MSRSRHRSRRRSFVGASRRQLRITRHSHDGRRVLEFVDQHAEPVRRRSRRPEWRRAALNVIDQWRAIDPAQAMNSRGVNCGGSGWGFLRDMSLLKGDTSARNWCKPLKTPRPSSKPTIFWRCSTAFPQSVWTNIGISRSSDLMIRWYLCLSITHTVVSRGFVFHTRNGHSP